MLFRNIAIALGFLGLLVGFSRPVLADEVNTNSDTESVTTFADHYYNTISHKARVSSSEKEFVGYLHQVAPKIIAFKYMSLWIIGPHRSKFSEEQLREFSDVFTTKLIKFYGGLIYQNRDKPVHLIGAQQNGKNVYTVTFVVNINQQDIHLDWHIRYSSRLNQYYITDVLVNGISFLQSKRLEYNALFNQAGQDPERFIELVKASSKEEAIKIAQ